MCLQDHYYGHIAVYTLWCTVHYTRNTWYLSGREIITLSERLWVHSFDWISVYNVKCEMISREGLGDLRVSRVSCAPRDKDPGRRGAVQWYNTKHVEYFDLGVLKWPCTGGWLSRTHLAGTSDQGIVCQPWEGGAHVTVSYSHCSTQLYCTHKCGTAQFLQKCPAEIW